MKIAYGTYGMPDVPIEEALPRLAEIGYTGVELAVGERWPTAPDKLDAGARAGLKNQVAELGLGVPALMNILDCMTAEEAVHRSNLEALRAMCALAHDVTSDEAPVITSTVGGQSAKWDEQKELLAERVGEWGSVIAEEGCQFAAEPHVGGGLDRVERVLWLLDRVDVPGLGLNFDISHFAIQGHDMEATVAALAPHAIHTHVKDGRMVDGKVQFLLPGEGDFDYVAYLRAMKAAGWDGFITVEITGQIWNQEGYDPWPGAEFSYRTLAEAFRASM